MAVGLTLYSERVCPISHRTRILVAEKGIALDHVCLDAGRLPEDLYALNPYHTLPTLVDRELVLYDARVVMDYLDERYPHPPLLPIDPLSRAKTRLALYRLEQDWYAPVKELSSRSPRIAEHARTRLRSSLLESVGLFRTLPFFLSADFGMADCYAAPILWRLEHYGIKLPKEARPLLDYGERLFARRGFQASRTERERELRE